MDQRFYLGLAIGFAAVITLAALLNKLGDIMFRKGMARPFYVKGHRIHHRDVLILTLPATYTLLVSLMMLNFVQVVWSAFLTGIETTLVIAAGCLLVDLMLDRVRFGARERAWLHHELIYLLIPAYFFTHVITVLA